MSQESLIHQTSGRFGQALGTEPAENIQNNETSGFSKPKFSSLNGNSLSKNYGQTKQQLNINQSSETGAKTVATMDTNRAKEPTSSALVSNEINISAPSVSDTARLIKKVPGNSRPMIGGKKVDKTKNA